MILNTRQIFEVRLTPTECETFSEILMYTNQINYLFDSPCFMPFEDEYDFPGFILTHSRLDALIRTLEKLSLVLPLYRGTPQPAGLQSFIASLREVAFGQNSLNYVETTKNMLTNSLISA